MVFPTLTAPSAHPTLQILVLGILILKKGDKIFLYSMLKEPTGIVPETSFWCCPVKDLNIRWAVKPERTLKNISHWELLGFEKPT